MCYDCPCCNGTETSAQYFSNNKEQERLAELVTDHITDNECCDSGIELIK